MPYLYEERSGGMLIGQAAELVVQALAFQNLFDAFSAAIRAAHHGAVEWEMPTRDRRVRWQLAGGQFQLEQAAPAISLGQAAEFADQACGD